MGELIPTEESFVRTLADQYRELGYEVVATEPVSERLGFRPDLVLRRNGEITVVEVKNDPATPGLQVREMRERARRQGYRFELKVVPRAPDQRLGPDDIARVPSLLARAKAFRADDSFDLAVLQSWIVIEIAIRVVSEKENAGDPRLTAPGDLVRLAGELGLYGEEELPILRALAELRNRIVHGFETDFPLELVDKSLDLAQRFAEMAGLNSGSGSS